MGVKWYASSFAIFYWVLLLDYRDEITCTCGLLWLLVWTIWISLFLIIHSMYIYDVHVHAFMHIWLGSIHFQIEPISIEPIKWRPYRHYRVHCIRCHTYILKFKNLRSTTPSELRPFFMGKCNVVIERDHCIDIYAFVYLKSRDELSDWLP